MNELGWRWRDAVIYLTHRSPNEPTFRFRQIPRRAALGTFGNALYEHGEAFYNFQGLRAFKQKFDPIWEPRYWRIPEGLPCPVCLPTPPLWYRADIAGFF